MSQNKKILRGNRTEMNVQQDMIPYNLTNAITQKVTPLASGIVAPSETDVIDAKRFVDKNHK